VTAGTNLSFTQDYNLRTCGDASAVVERDMCRIATRVRTSERSGEFWWWEREMRC
jgi:feruloyl esterase